MNQSMTAKTKYMLHASGVGVVVPPMKKHPREQVTLALPFDLDVSPIPPLSFTRSKRSAKCGV